MTLSLSLRDVLVLTIILVFAAAGSLGVMALSDLDQRLAWELV